MIKAWYYSANLIEEGEALKVQSELTLVNSLAVYICDLQKQVLLKQVYICNLHCLFEAST